MYYYTTIRTHQYTTTLLCYYTNILLHYYTTTLLHYCTTTLLRLHSSIPPRRRRARVADLNPPPPQVHAMMPNLGQGGCQAIEDAAVLGEELARISSRTAIPGALRRYRARRNARSAAVQGLSRIA